MSKIAKKMKTLRAFKVREGVNSYSIEFVRVYDFKSDCIMYAVFVCTKGNMKMYAYDSDYYLVRNYFIRLILANNSIRRCETV